MINIRSQVTPSVSISSNSEKHLAVNGQSKKFQRNAGTRSTKADWSEIFVSPQAFNEDESVLKSFCNYKGLNSGFNHFTLNIEISAEAKSRPKGPASLRLNFDNLSEVATLSALRLSRKSARRNVGLYMESIDVELIIDGCSNDHLSFTL